MTIPITKGGYQDKSMRELFFAHDGLPCDKWHHYLDVYDRHFARFRNAPVRLLEIGVQLGGSLELWRKFFGEAAVIHGLDIDPSCALLDFSFSRASVTIGDQANHAALEQCLKALGGLDIVIDDGGHMNEAQRQSFLYLFPLLSRQGIYLCEDVHTSYWSQFDGGLCDPRSFIEFSKAHIDFLNAHHDGLPTDFARMTSSIHYYDSIVVFERGGSPPPVRSVQGKK